MLISYPEFHVAFFATVQHPPVYNRVYWPWVNDCTEYWQSEVVKINFVDVESDLSGSGFVFRLAA